MTNRIMKKIYILCDLEGVTGIASTGVTTPTALWIYPDSNGWMRAQSVL